MTIEIRKERNIKYFNLLLLGVVLYANVDVLQDYVIGKSLFLRSFSLIGLMLFWYSFFKLPKWNIASQKYASVLYFFAFIGIVTVLRQNPNSEFTLYRKMMIGSYLWTYLMPLLLFVKIEKYYIKYCLYWTLFQIFLDAIFLFFNFPAIIQTSGAIMGMSGFDSLIIGRFSLSSRLVSPIIAFCFVMNKFKIKWQFIIIIAIILSFVSSMMGGRRSSSVLIIIGLLLSIGSYIKKPRNFLIFILIMLSLSFYSMNISNSFFDIFSTMSERITADTRSGTEKDFYNDMELSDWILGRGVDGTYKSLSVSLVDQLHRFLIETGYLNLVLHGGLLFLLPYVYFLVKSSYLGFFKSRNTYIKGFAMYIFVHLIFLYPGGTPSLDLRYTILFVLIGFCINSYNIEKDYDFEISHKILKT